MSGPETGPGRARVGPGRPAPVGLTGPYAGAGAAARAARVASQAVVWPGWRRRKQQQQQQQVAAATTRTLVRAGFPTDRLHRNTGPPFKKAVRPALGKPECKVWGRKGKAVSRTVSRRNRQDSGLRGETSIDFYLNRFNSSATFANAEVNLGYVDDCIRIHFLGFRHSFRVEAYNIAHQACPPHNPGLCDRPAVRA